MTVTVVALSGRALAAAARRAGEVCHVVDFFGDDDTVAFAMRSIRAAGDPATGFTAAALETALDALADITGFVYGSGFEHDPALLRMLAARAPLLGNPAETVAAVKDPLRFVETLKRLGLPHPEISMTSPSGTGWLVKRIGGSGGSHIGVAPARSSHGTYFQRHVPGRPAAVLFAADGRNARVLGTSTQWCDPAPDAPFRYGGCAAPEPALDRLAPRLGEACTSLTEAFALRGLNSLDILVDGPAFHVLEINPRPGATFDIFDGFAGLSLWRIHGDAVAGRLPETLPVVAEGRAAAVVHARDRRRVPPGFVWPDWAADRQAGGSIVGAGDPICTVTARGASATEARASVQRRAAAILDALVAVPEKETA